MEEKRTFLAKKGFLKELIETYKINGEEIPDLNSPKLWDNLNLREHVNKLNNPIAWERLNFVTKILTNKGSSILDIGFGAGDLEEMLNLSAKKYDLFGLDISPESVKKASNNYPIWNFKVGSITSLDFKDETFDYVIALEVLEHIKISQIFKALKEVNRVLKKRGVFILSIPINEDLEIMVNKGSNPNAHVRTYSEALIKAELKISDFEPKLLKKLFAFKDHYLLKSFIARLSPGIKKPNNLILAAYKK